MKPRKSWIGRFGLALLVLGMLGSDSGLAASSYIVRADDKLAVKIFQFPELNGEYTVSANGTISIATIGDIRVGGLSTKEAASRISQRFVQARLSDKPGASVELIESRPVYVVGDVQKPGAYPFRPGLTVLQAVSLAGGWLRFNDPGLMRIERDAINIKGDMRTLIRKYYALIASQARLKAELFAEGNIEFPAQLTQRARSDAALTQLMDEEKTLWGIHTEAMKKQIASLQRSRSLYERQIQAITRQIQANKVQYDSVGKELKKIKILVGRGLSTATRQMGLERMQAQIEMTEQGFQTLILQARQGISQVDQKMFDLKSERNAALTAELQRTRLDLDEVGVKFQTNQSLLVEAQLTAPTLIGDSDGIIVTRSLSVDRVRDGKAQTIDVDERTELLPGDVLRVRRSILPSLAGRELPAALDSQPLGPHNGITPISGKN